MSRFLLLVLLVAAAAVVRPVLAEGTPAGRSGGAERGLGLAQDGTGAAMQAGLVGGASAAWSAGAASPRGIDHSLEQVIPCRKPSPRHPQQSVQYPASIAGSALNRFSAFAITSSFWSSGRTLEGRSKYRGTPKHTRHGQANGGLGDMTKDPAVPLVGQSTGSRAMA